MTGEVRRMQRTWETAALLSLRYVLSYVNRQLKVYYAIGICLGTCVYAMVIVLLTLF